MDVLVGSRAETSQATSCHLPLPAQPRQTGPAGVRKSEVDIIIITKKTARTSHHSLLSVVPTIPILHYDYSNIIIVHPLLLILLSRDRQKHLKCL